MNDTLLLGCGNLGLSIVKSFCNEKKNIHVHDSNDKILRDLNKSKFLKIIYDFDNISWKKFDYIILCVKPKDVKGLLSDCKNFLNQDHILISFVAGLLEQQITSIIQKQTKIIRLMPNLLAKIKKSSTGAFSKSLSLEEKRLIQKTFSFLGNFVWLDKEDEMNFFTAFFGGGPAYICYFIKILDEILLANGFKNKETKNLVLNLIVGTIDLIELEKKDFKRIINMVASKKGTTERALEYFDYENRFFELVSSAIKKAKQRSEEISKVEL